MHGGGSPPLSPSRLRQTIVISRKFLRAVIEELTAKPEFKDLVVFNMDIDTQKQVCAGSKCGRKAP